MKSKWLTYLGLLVLAALVLGACATPAADDSAVTDLQEQLDAALANAGASDEEIAALEAELDEAMAAAQAGGEEEAMGAEPITLTFNWGSEPPTADPSMSEDTTSSNVIGSIFMGLTDQDDVTKEIIPSLATSWEANADNTVWTFNLRDDVPWVQYNPTTGETTQAVDDDGNPRFVTANDVVYGIKRTCDPVAASNYAWLLYPFTGCEVLNTTDPSAEEYQGLYDSMGVRALDDNTIEITLEFGASFLPGLVSMANAYPVPQWVIEEKGDRWIEPGFIITNGAYVMDEWVHGDHLTLVKNPLWPLWGTDYAPGNIEKVVGFTIQEASTEFAMCQ